MGTNIDKALNGLPFGLTDGMPSPVGGEDDYEGGIEVILPDEEGEDAIETIAEPAAFGANLAETLGDTEITTLITQLTADVDNDLRSRTEWEKIQKDGLKLLGLHIEEKTEPWDGACGVFHPMITEAAIRFQAETITETFPAKGPVKTKIIGKEDRPTREAALRVENDMNYELTEVMKEFRPEHERMLFNLPTAGSAFKKVYDDPNLGRQTSVFVPAEDMILPYGMTDMDTAPRYTHVMRKHENDVKKLIAAGFYMETVLGEPTKELDDIKQAKDKEIGASDLNDDRYVIYEIHADLDLENGDSEDGIAVPYVVHVIKGDSKPLAVYRNWEEGDPLKKKRQHFIHYQYIPGLGAYGFGLFHLIGGFARSATSIMRQLVDAGTLSNLPGGLKSRGLRIKGDDTPIGPGEWRDVDVASGNIRDSILPLPYKGADATLHALLKDIVEEGRRIAASADMEVSDMSAQAPVGTTLALLERQLKVLTAVQARTHFSLKQELGLLKNIMKGYAEEGYDYEPAWGKRSAKRSDYDMVDVIPVSDPNAATMSQRVVQYQAAIQMAQMAPDIYDLPILHRDMLEVLGFKNANKIVPLEEDHKPKDPVSENQGLMSGKPTKAFLYQDHDAHIAVHGMVLQDPVYAQLIGQNPRAPAIQAAIMAHIAEHAGFKMRRQIEAALGMPLPPEGEELPPEVETVLSSLMARAAMQVSQQDAMQMQAQAAQAAAQDPVMQMQQKEVAIKEQEVQIKARAEDRKDKELQLKSEGQRSDDAIELARLDHARRDTAARLKMDAEKFQNDLDERQASRVGQERQGNVKNKIESLKALAAGRPNINPKGGSK